MGEGEVSMADYVRVMIAIAAQWRVVRAIGPAAIALVGVPVAGQPAGPAARPVAQLVPAPALASRKQQKGGSGTGR